MFLLLNLTRSVLRVWEVVVWCRRPVKWSLTSLDFSDMCLQSWKLLDALAVLLESWMILEDFALGAEIAQLKCLIKIKVNIGHVIAHQISFELSVPCDHEHSDISSLV